MFKKFFSIIALVVLLFVVTSCNKKQDNPDDNNNNNNNNQTEFEYKTPETDKLKLTESYEGKDFIKDGIGEVTVAQYVDGDTTIFKTVTSNESFTVRYNGVNTPESTYKVEPWGFAASKYTKDALKAAKKIVLTCEDPEDRLDSTGRRYLAWVWLIDETGDSRLLNLELVELALGYSKANGTHLGDIFSTALYNASIARVRIYGETDPNFDYSTEARIMTIKEIRDTYGTPEASMEQKGKGTLVAVSGVVTRMNGVNSCYIQQYDTETDEYYGIYVYGGFTTRSEFKLGNSIVIECRIGFYYGSLQLTDPSSIKLRQWADKENPEKNIHCTDITDNTILTIENYLNFGKFANIHNLTVTGGSNADSNAFTIKCTYEKEDQTTERLDIRVDANIVLKDSDGNRITSWEYFQNKTFSSCKCIISYYDYNTEDTNYGYVQLLLTSMNDVEFAN